MYLTDNQQDQLEELMDDIIKEFKVETCHSLDEALAENILFSQQHEITEMLRTHDFEALGRKIWSLNWDYWEKQAEQAARRILEKENVI